MSSSRCVQIVGVSVQNTSLFPCSVSRMCQWRLTIVVVRDNIHGYLRKLLLRYSASSPNTFFPAVSMMYTGILLNIKFFILQVLDFFLCFSLTHVSPISSV